MRKNKSKKDIVSDIQLVQDADRRRALIRDVIFPFLSEIKESIAYSKVFLQAFNALVNGVFDEQRKTTTLGHLERELEKKLLSTFKTSDQEQKREFDRYMKLISLLKEVSIQDLTYATELPRYIDGFIVQERAKDSIETISIEKILGK